MSSQIRAFRVPSMLSPLRDSYYHWMQLRNHRDLCCCCCSVIKSCPLLCDTMICSLPVQYSFVVKNPTCDWTHISWIAADSWPLSHWTGRSQCTTKSSRKSLRALQQFRRVTHSRHPPGNPATCLAGLTQVSEDHQCWDLDIGDSGYQTTNSRKIRAVMRQSHTTKWWWVCGFT